MSSKPRLVALIPARSGSKRIPNKNVRPLAGHPLISYTIAAARDSRAFAGIVVSTDSNAIAKVAKTYGAEAPFLRPKPISGDVSPDIEWVKHALDALEEADREYDAFSILRPTSPFRKAATIRRAWTSLQADPSADSLRAVEKAKQHPGKMWIVRGSRMTPLLPMSPKNPPWHSTPYQALPIVHVQNASLEIAWTRTVRKTGTIAGDTIVPFLTEGLEGFDLNSLDDWVLAEHFVKTRAARLPRPKIVHGGA